MKLIWATSVPAPSNIPVKSTALATLSTGALLQMAAFGSVTPVGTVGSAPTTCPLLAIPQHNEVSSPQVSAAPAHGEPTPEVGSGGAGVGGVGVGGVGSFKHSNPALSKPYTMTVLLASSPVIVPTVSTA